MIMEAYEKKYKDAQKWIESIYTELSHERQMEAEAFFLELKESEDERIRKNIKIALMSMEDNLSVFYSTHHTSQKELLAWLEKLGRSELDLPQKYQDSNRPNGGIVSEDFTDGEGFYKLNLAYLNKKQVEDVEEIVRLWNIESDTTEDDIKDCIGMCLTDADEQRFKNYNTNLRDCLAWLERQGEQDKEYLYDVIVALWDLLDKIDTVSELYIDDTDSDNPFRKIMHIMQERHKFVKSDGYNLFIDNVKITNRKSPEKQSEQDTINRIEPKFKVGDWVLWDNKICCHINDIRQGEKYLVYTITDTNNLIRSYAVECFDKNARIWTIDDAKDGDILTWDDSGCITLFNCIHADGKSFDSHGFVGHCTGIFHAERTSYHDVIGAHPATKEQRDTLFEKMKEAGYEWSSEKKELRKIEGELKNHEQYTMSEIADSVIDFKQKPEQSNEGNFDMAGLYYAKAILEKTLGKVEGYQSDDGILEHKSAINAVTKLCEQADT